MTMPTSPRERFPDLAPYLTDANIEAWEKAGYCLCGCGEVTSLLKGRGPGHCYFKNGHASIMRKAHGLAKIHNSPKTQKFYQALQQNNFDRSIDAERVLQLLQEWLWQNNMSVWDFSNRYGFGEGALYSAMRDVRDQQNSKGRQNRRRIYRDTAERILDIISSDIPPHPSRFTTKGPAR